MSVAIIATIAINIIVVVVLLTVFIYYYNLSFECDTYASPQCKTDWKCSGYDPGSNSIVMVNNQGYGVTNRMLGCYLSALYGVDMKENEYGEPCQYAPLPNGNPGPAITVRSMKTMSEDPAPGCNVDGGVKTTPGINGNWTPMAVTGLYQNVYSASGKNSLGLNPAYPCETLDGVNCLTVAQLMSLRESSNNTQPNFFTNKIGSCLNAP